MTWAQIRGGNKMHLALEAGEALPSGEVIRRGFISAPLCGTRAFRGEYRMTSNVPWGHSCRNCVRIANARSRR